MMKGIENAPDMWTMPEREIVGGGYDTDRALARSCGKPLHLWRRVILQVGREDWVRMAFKAARKVRGIEGRAARTGYFISRLKAAYGVNLRLSWGASAQMGAARMCRIIREGGVA